MRAKKLYMGKFSKTLTLFLTIIIAMQSLTLLMVRPADALNSTEHVFNSTSVYGIDGHGVRIGVNVNNPVFEANSTLLSFELQVLEPFNARGIVVNQTDYYVSRKTLDFYLLAGVLLDYDRSALIDTLWNNWADTLNTTYVNEEHKLYSQNVWVNLTKSGISYIGTAVLPVQGVHNATFWIRAEQDQVTTYIPLWAAFPKTIAITNQEVSPTSTVPEDTSSLTPNIPRNPPHLDPIAYLIPISVIAAVIILTVLIFRRRQNP